MGEASDRGGGQLPTDPPAVVQFSNASTHVFISYASQDAAVANAVVGALERYGVRCWIAPRDVVPGALYADEIVRAINEAQVVVLILSEQAAASAHVGKEIERASSKRRRIVALRTDSVSLPRAFEYFLSESQWIEVGSGGIDAAAATLLEAVRRHLESSASIESLSHSANAAPNRGPAISRRRWLLAGSLAALSLALGYFVVRHSWPAKQPGIAPVAQIDKMTRAAPAASIAVLPFSDLSAEANEGYFSDGIAEEILNVLAHVNGLKVASRTSSFQFRKSDLGAPAIAEKLGVRHLLEGSVRKAGDTVRITAQLIDASTDQHEWSESFDRPLNTANLFAIQDEIAQSIVTHLAASLGGMAEIGRPAARKADTADEGAYDLYLKGRALFIARNKQNLRAAIAPLKAAVAKDPKFARAWEMLAAVLVIGEGSWDVGDAADYQTGVDAISMALRLDPNLSLAYAVRGEVQGDAIPGSGEVNWEDSFESFSRAIEHDGTNATAYVWRGVNYVALGYFDRGISDYLRCLDLDPAYELCRRHLAMAYLSLGRTDDALSLVQTGLEHGYLFSDVSFATAVAARGDRFGALDILARQYVDDPQLIRPLFRALTDPAFNNRDREDAVGLVKRSKNSATFVPAALLLLKAYEQITTAPDDPPIWWYRDDAWLKSPSRKRLMQVWHLPEYWGKHGFPPQCRAIGKSDFECR